MSNDLSLRASMDTIRPVSQLRDTDGQIAAVSTEERDVIADTRDDVSVSSNDVPAESRVIVEIDETTLNRAVDELAQRAQSISRDLSFTIDEHLNKTVITVSDSSTEEVIRQIPSEEVLSLARSMSNDDAVLINVKA